MMARLPRQLTVSVRRPRDRGPAPQKYVGLAIPGSGVSTFRQGRTGHCGAGPRPAASQAAHPCVWIGKSLVCSGAQDPPLPYRGAGVVEQIESNRKNRFPARPAPARMFVHTSHWLWEVHSSAHVHVRPLGSPLKVGMTAQRRPGRPPQAEGPPHKATREIPGHQGRCL